MNRSNLLLALVIGSLSGALLFVESDSTRPMVVRACVAMGVFSAYSAFVYFGTSGKKRELSVMWQTLLGVLVALVIAAVLGASGEGYVAAALVGVILGFTADYWSADD